MSVDQFPLLDQTLLYRRQFFAGASIPSPLSRWSTVRFSSDIVVGYHPELEIALAHDGDRKLLCLGHVLDPSSPELTNEEVLGVILKGSEDFSSFEATISRLGGRWVFFISIQGQIRVYHDAGGLKSVFYYAPVATNEIWIASQPSLFSECCSIVPDLDLVQRFHASNHQNSWVGQITPYPQVRQLLPNHFLHVQARTSSRFWPVKDVALQDLDTAAKAMGDIIHGLIAGVVQRGPVALPLTGGYESRVSFSCAKELRARIPLFLVTAPNTLLHDEILSKRIARQFGHSVKYIQAMGFDEVFWNTLLHNTGQVCWDPGENLIYTFREHFPGCRMLFGHMGTVVRSWYYKDGKHPPVLDENVLAEAIGVSGNPIAIAALTDWFQEVPKGLNISPLDLLFWEHRQGNWASMISTAYDTVGCDTSSPFNCRSLMEIGLGTTVEYRKPPHTLLRRICELTAGPRALSVPINRSMIEDGINLIWKPVPWRIRKYIDTVRMRLAGVPDCFLSDKRFF